MAAPTSTPAKPESASKSAIITAAACGALITGVLLFAVVLYQINFPLTEFLGQQNVSHSFTPLGSSPSSEGLTGFLYLIPTIAFTFILVIGLKRNPGRWLKVFIAVSFAITSFLVGLIEYWWWLGIAYTAVLILFLAGLMVISYGIKPTDKYARAKSAILSAPFKIWMTVGLAFLLFTVLPFFTALALCGGAALWDMYAVFRGPLKTIVESKDSKETHKDGQPRVKDPFAFLKRTLMVDFGLGGIGYGDLVFYSLLILLACELGTTFILLGAAMIVGGVLISYYILRSRNYNALPGLPLPVLFFVVMIGVLVFA